MDNNDWPLIEFVAPSQGILAKFTPSTSEAVANILIRELVHRVDRPSPSDVNAFSNDHELEWIMQVINHGLTLPFTSNESYETLRSAVRIYLAYLSALTNTPHHCCPKQLLIQPDRYFRKILEAFRRIFENRCPPSGDTSLLLQLSRQATQIGTILQAIMKLATSVMEEFRDEVWPRSLLFLINAADQIMSIEKCKTQESIGFLMAADLSDILFGCLTGAALAELIPSPSYWRTLSVLSWKCGHQVQFIESWAKTLLNSTIVLLHNLYGQPAYPLCDDNQTFEPFLTNPVTADKLRLFKDLWHNLFILLGNPSEFLKYGISQCEISINDRNNFNFFAEQLALSFFLTILAFKKMIDLFLGDFITIGFNESEELNCQWLESASATAGGMAPELDQQKRGSNTSINLSQQQMRNIRSQQQYFEAVPEKTAPSNEAPAQNFARDEIMAVRIAGRVRGGQHVWYILRSNTFKKASHLFSPLQTRPSASSLLAVFLDCLYESAALSMNNNNHNNTILQLSAKQSKNNAGASVMEDALSQKSTESGASLMDPCPTVGKAHHKQQEPDQLSQKFVTLRRSFANSISGSSTSNQESAQMVGGDHHNFSSPTEMPSVNGISSGRATAVGALCRIVCSKASRETFSDEQMARFFAILHEALLSRDRLVLCSLLYYSSDSLFKLAIRGVQILLPNYLMAIDIVLTESTKLPLHPSITPADMRASCLRALASLLPWPSVFGATHILGQKSPLGKSKQICRQGSSSNLLEPEMRYVDLCGHIQKMLVFSLRNETDPPNIQYSLALSTLFCAESAKYNLLDGSRECVERKAEKEGEAEENNGREKKREEYDRAKGSISLIRAVISAVCDNLCKPAWAKGTLCCLAAFDCLNCLSTIPHQILFHNGELSTGSLVVTSLCRFIDQQLRKPPPHHSRDMHSTVVAAYFCMDVWLTAAPCLSNIESCLSTVADTIELGMTGGHQLPTDQYKPASQRVHDAAQALLQSLFSNANKKTPTSSMAVNEIMLAQKFDLNLAQFQHYLINQSTLLSLHEAQHIHQLSKGLPTVICVFRTPFYEPWAGLIQLLPKAKSRKSNEGSREMGQQNDGQPSQQQPNELSPGCHSITNLGGMDESSKQQQQESETAQGNANAETNLTNGVGQKQFEIPPEVLQPQCQLDLRFPKLEPVPAEVEDIQSRLIQIRTRLSQRSGAPCGDRDSRNVWLNTSLGAILAKSPTPDSPAVHCNSLRVFLHDMGLINRNAYGSELIPLDSSSFDIFYDSLSVTVDQFSFRLNEQVSLFYAKEGQRTAEDILQNNINLRHTSANFCRLLSALGKAVGTRKTTVEASGDGTTRNKDSSIECFVLDGVDYYLRWRDSQMEIAFITPTGRIPVEESRKLAQKLQQQQQSLLLSSLRKTTTTPLLDVGHNQQQQQIYRSKSSKSTAIDTRTEELYVNTNNTAAIGKEKVEKVGEEEKTTHFPSINRSMWHDLNKKRALLIWAQSVDEISEMDDEFSSKTHHQPGEMKILSAEEGDDGNLSMSTEILTFPTTITQGTAEITDFASLSLMTATNVVVKSARFSPRRKPASPLISTNVSHQHSECSFTEGASGGEQQLLVKKAEEEDVENSKAAEDTIITDMGKRPRSSSELPPPSSSLVVQQQQRSSRQLKKSEFSSTHPIHQQNDQRQSGECLGVTLSPPMTPSAYNAKTRRRSSIFRDLLGANNSEKRKESADEKSSAGGDGFGLGERKESLALSEASQASTATSSNKGKVQLQHTNSVTTISYLKSFFRRASKATTSTATPTDTPRMDRRKSRVMIDEAIVETTPSESSEGRCFSTRESFASSTTGGGGIGRTQNMADFSDEKSPFPPGDDFDPSYQTIKSNRTMSCASTISNADHSATPKYAKRSTDLRILVVWLERLEDMDTFPLADLLPFTASGKKGQENTSHQEPLKLPLPNVDHIAFFLFQFERGLVRVQVDGVWTKYGQPGPLLDGTVVSMRALPELLKQTVCNIARRKAIEVENYQMTHLRRKQAIAEFGRRFGTRLSYTDFMEQFLLLNPTAETGQR